MIDYNDKKFKAVQNTINGETSEETVFHYKQNGNIVSSDYSGGKIIKGNLIGIVSSNGEIDMRYHQINIEGKLMTGTCKSIPEILPNGKIRLHEEWRWTCDDESEGKSIIEEL